MSSLKKCLWTVLALGVFIPSTSFASAFWVTSDDVHDQEAENQESARQQMDESQARDADAATDTSAAERAIQWLSDALGLPIS